MEGVDYGSLSGGTQHEIAFSVTASAVSPDGGAPINAWVLAAAVDTGPYNTIGFYPLSDYTGPMANGTATFFQVGGEVFDSTKGWIVPMGSGGNSEVGYVYSAYHYNYQACYLNVDQEDCNDSFAVEEMQAGPVVQDSYDWDTESAPSGGTGSGAWYNWFYFGNSPRVFWDLNYGFNWSPTNPADWDKYNYKGECQVGQPVTGVSRVTSGVESMTVLCGPTTEATSGCYFRALGTGNQCDNDNGVDWDKHYYKDECCADEFVSGVAQSTSGDLSGVLCCPGSVTHQSCVPEVFYSTNSTDFQWPDWSYGNYKGQCKSGQYVAGISSPSSGYGTIGAAHALWCCGP